MTPQLYFKGGRNTFPFAKPFRGPYHGDFTDKFGVPWALNPEPKA